MQLPDLLDPRHRPHFRNTARILAIVCFQLIMMDLHAQVQVTWHDFSSGFQNYRGEQLSVLSMVGETFSGIQGAGHVTLASGCATFVTIGGAVSEVRTDELMPATFDLAQNFPNPFNPSTVITYDLPEESRMVIALYSLLGQKVATLVDDVVAPGRHSVTWTGRGDDGGTVPSGVYFYRMQAGEFVQVRRLVLLK